MKFAWLLAATLLLAGASQAALRLELDPEHLDPAQRQASQALLDEAFAALPPSFIERLDRRVGVRWSDELPASTYGRAIRPDALLLNARLRERIAQLQERTGAEGDIVVDSGDPHKLVARTAETLGADLVVIGRGVSADLLGRLRAHAYEIIRLSPCPVVSI